MGTIVLILPGTNDIRNEIWSGSRELGTVNGRDYLLLRPESHFLFCKQVTKEYRHTHTTHTHTLPQTHRYIHAETHTDAQTDTCTDTHTDVHTDTHTETNSTSEGRAVLCEKMRNEGGEGLFLLLNSLNHFRTLSTIT